MATTNPPDVLGPLRFLALLLCANHAAAQCAPAWEAGYGLPGAWLSSLEPGAVFAQTLWDPDGSGPQQPVVVVGGVMSGFGAAIADGLAVYDPATGTTSAFPGWAPDTSLGFPPYIESVATLADGSIVVGGFFDLPLGGGSWAINLARYDGTHWHAWGNPNNPVRAASVHPSGDIYIGGNFTSVGGVAANRIARWNGSAWTALGSGCNSTVRDLAITSSGDVIAGGDFTMAGGVTVNRIARWNGASWSAFGTGANAGVNTLLILPGGNLVAGGQFTTIGGVSANRIAVWNGTSWSPLGAGTNNAVREAILDQAGNLLVGGNFADAGGVPANSVARWDGATWTALGTGVIGSVSTLLELPGGIVLAGGNFPGGPGFTAWGYARWNGTGWHAIATGIDGEVTALAEMPNGDLIVAGNFTSIRGVAATQIARWDGSAWHPLGSGITGGSAGPYSEIRCMVVMPNGDLIVAGDFATAGGVAAASIARWNGANWSALGGGIPSSALAPGIVDCMAVMPDGTLYVGGSFDYAGGVGPTFLVRGLARWNGSGWSKLAPEWHAGGVRAMSVGTDGSLYLASSSVIQWFVGASMQSAVVARWNGTQLTRVGNAPLGPPFLGPVTHLLTLPNGDLLLSGQFTDQSFSSQLSLARWNGNTWQTILNNNEYLQSMALLPNGDVVVRGSFLAIGSVPANDIARWNGTTWFPIGSGIESSAVAPGLRSPVLCTSSGSIVTGGTILRAGGNVSVHLARYTTPCPPQATNSGQGCTSSGGSNTLTAVTPAWLGSTLRTRATGLPGMAFAFALIGFAPTSVPLGSLLPQAGAGCNQLVTDDLVWLLGVNSGVADFQVGLPNNPVFAGFVLHHQMLPLEIDAQVNAVELTATNALQFTMGSL